MKNLLLRTISGIVFVLVVLSGIWFGPYSFAGVFGLITVLCLYEFYKLMNLQEGVSVRPLINCAAGLYLFLSTFMSFHWGYPFFLLFLPYLFYMISIFVTELYLRKSNPIHNWAYSFLGQMYIAVPFSLLNILCFRSGTSGETVYQPVLLLALFAFIWINDTGAYLVGVSIGKHRLFERISPKKSWEGFFGGALFAIASSLAFAYYVPDLSTMQWICLSAVTVVFATWGDLVESLLKRTIGVKDSGNMIPGHGGILDRLDSVMLAAPALTFFYFIIMAG